MQGYTLKRLVKGLASGNAGARQGFALALTLLLKRLPGMTADDAVLLLASYLEAPSASKVSGVDDGRQTCHAVGFEIGQVGGFTSGHASLHLLRQGAETRDYLLGRTFGIGAIVQARVPASTACKAEMIDQLLDAGVLKSFLREAAGARPAMRALPIKRLFMWGSRRPHARMGHWTSCVLLSTHSPCACAATVILDLVASETEESVSALLSACAPLSAALSASIDQSTPEVMACGE